MYILNFVIILTYNFIFKHIVVVFGTLMYIYKIDIKFNIMLNKNITNSELSSNEQYFFFFDIIGNKKYPMDNNKQKLRKLRT